MAINGKNSIHYTRKDTDTSKSIAVGFKKMKFWHEPTQGDTVIDLNSLTFPSSGVPTNATQPSATELTGAKLLINKDNFTLISSLSGVLDFDSYEITGNMEITLSEGTEEGELFTGIIDHVPRTGLQVLDTVPGVQTFTLTAGSDEVVTSTNFELNAHPTKQIGAVMVFLDGQLMLRNVSNVAAAPAADGNYQELGTGSSGSSIKFNETSGVDREVQIVPTATFNVAPTDTMMALIEKVAGENNKIIPTVAALAGVPESTFTSAPSAVDGANFGQRVVDLENLYDKTQTKLLTSSSVQNTANNALDVTELTFNNLTIGKDYRIDYDLMIVSQFGGAGDTFLYQIDDGGTVLERNFIQNTTVGQSLTRISLSFTAATTLIKFQLNPGATSTVCILNGLGSNGATGPVTRVTLTEFNKTQLTTDWT